VTFLDKMNLQYQRLEIKKDRKVSCNVNIGNGKNILIACENFQQTAVNRGGSITILSGKRLKPCYQVFERLCVDYNGLCLPCCNVRGDYNKHSSLIIGDSNKQTLADIFMGQKITKIRRQLCSFGIKNGDVVRDVCMRCDA
jgi:hypothetical protein